MRHPSATPPFRVLVSDPIDAAGLAHLRQVASVEVKTDLTPAQLRAEIGAYHALMVRSQTKVTAEIVEAGRQLRVIGRAGVGVDNIDVSAATRRGVVVVNSPDGNTVAAAEQTLALMFALARHTAAADASTRSGAWKRSAYVGVELSGKTLGVVGLGRIGRHVARVARALGMTVLAHDPSADAARALEPGVELTSLASLAARADFITLHAPKTPETTHLLDAALLAACKPGVRIVNTARGGLIDEAALVAAIRSGHVAGAALDVYAAEPTVSEALRSLGERVVLTPHLGASTEEAQLKVALDVAEQIAEVLAGGAARTPVNLERPAPPCGTGAPDERVPA